MSRMRLTDAITEAAGLYLETCGREPQTVTASKLEGSIAVELYHDSPPCTRRYVVTAGVVMAVEDKK